MANMWEIAAIVILLMILGACVYTYYSAWQYRNTPIGNTGQTLAKSVSTRGMNGVAGQNLQLTCPAGQVISFKPANTTSTRGALICTGDSKCDAFYQKGGQTKTFFNPSTTIDVFANDSKFTDLAACEGQNKCEWTIPGSSDSRVSGCIASCKGQVSFIGTYDCIAA